MLVKKIVFVHVWLLLTSRWYVLEELRETLGEEIAKSEEMSRGEQERAEAQERAISLREYLDSLEEVSRGQMNPW